jgi:hypothetical protein
MQITSEPKTDLKGLMRGYFIEFIKDEGKGITCDEFELVSKFEDYIFKKLSEKGDLYANVSN